MVRAASMTVTLPPRSWTRKSFRLPALYGLECPVKRETRWYHGIFRPCTRKGVFIFTVEGGIMMIEITFPDGSKKQFSKGITPEQIAASISKSLQKKSVAAIVNDELYDLNRPIEQDASVHLITKQDKKAYEVLNHSAAHLLAQAVKRLYPNATFGVGPAIREGFYYDIDADEIIKEEDLKRIEQTMHQIVKENAPIVRKEVTR